MNDVPSAFSSPGEPRPALPAAERFRAAPGLAHPHLQSLLATKRPAHWLWRRRGLDLNALSAWHLLDAGNGIRLSGLHTPAAAAPRGLAVLIHGWEGSCNSNYLYSMAARLHRAGYALFRLNLRDHGGTHHLNEGMFNSARMDEVIRAIAAVQLLEPAQPLVVIGFSLGGSFALRVGIQGPPAGVHPALCVGISPLMNPLHTLQAIDRGPRAFNSYFLAKWRASMNAKDRAWPGLYDFRDHRRLTNFVELTERFVLDFTEFDSLDDYLQRYTLTPALLSRSPTPLALITSRDDSVIPIADFDGLRDEGSVLAFDVTDRGGHCGFIANWGLESWAESRVLALLNHQGPGELLAS